MAIGQDPDTARDLYGHDNHRRRSVDRFANPPTSFDTELFALRGFPGGSAANIVFARRASGIYADNFTLLKV